MYDDIADHRILGQFTLKIAEALDCIIEFGGKLHEGKIEKVSGRISAIDYATVNGRIAQHHAGDIEFMRNWLSYKNFYMIQ